MPTPEQRHAACTHLNVTRLFDPLDSHKCHMCGRSSALGWLYRCTQDHDSFLPEADFFSTAPENANSRLSEQCATSQLSQSILRGIEDGQYSPEQIELLRAQKLQVKEFIAMQEEKLEKSSDSSQTSSSLSSSDSALENSVLATNELQQVLQHRDESPGSNSTRDSTIIDEGAHRLMPTTPKETHVESLVLKCHFMCCPSCRPAYKDRAFQSLAAILEEPFKPPPLWELENRRISDANLLKSVTTSQPRPHPRHMFQTFDDSKNLPESDTGGSSGNEDGDAEINGMKDKVRRRSGFKATVRKALGAIDQSISLTKSSKNSSKSSSRDSLVQSSRSMLFRRRRKQADKENQIVSSSALQESLALMLAVNTPLPRASGDSDSLGNGEVQVEDGVAVTEEGVEMSAADIIIQA
jgi:hypothetical protein